MFTPQEVSEKVFPKASFGSGGYSMSSVDEFLDALTEDYTAIFKENVTLKAKLKVLAEKVEEYRSTEEAMRQALLTAQKMASKLVQEAQSEKEEILAKARVEAQEEIHRLDAERQAEERKLAMAQQKTAVHPPQPGAVPGADRLFAVPAGAGAGRAGAARSDGGGAAQGRRGLRHRAGHPQPLHRSPARGGQVRRHR